VTFISLPGVLTGATYSSRSLLPLPPCCLFIRREFEVDESFAFGLRNLRLPAIPE